MPRKTQKKEMWAFLCSFIWLISGLSQEPARVEENHLLPDLLQLPPPGVTPGDPLPVPSWEDGGRPIRNTHGCVVHVW